MIIVEKESFMSTIPIQKTLSKEELYTLIQNYQKNHDQKSKEMIILSNTKLVLSLMKRFYQKSNQSIILIPIINYSFQRMQFL